jgi:hypothetical protein
MKTLFDNDPAMKMRDSHGRYATPERAYADKAKKELAYWKLKAEKFKRMYESAVWLVDYKDRVIKKLKGE